MKRFSAAPLMKLCGWLLLSACGGKVRDLDDSGADGTGGAAAGAIAGGSGQGGSVRAQWLIPRRRQHGRRREGHRT